MTDVVALTCTHLDQIRTVIRRTDGCEECLRTGDDWVHLRLREAALAHDPPSKTPYDPERDGVRCRSLEVHEHWNNGTEKKYSRNLGKAQGIELYQV